MSYLRFRLDLAVKQPIPPALQALLPDIRDKIRQLRSYASNITPNEITVIAKYHICHHDEALPCEPEIDV